MSSHAFLIPKSKTDYRGLPFHLSRLSQLRRFAQISTVSYGLGRFAFEAFATSESFRSQNASCANSFHIEGGEKIRKGAGLKIQIKRFQRNKQKEEEGVYRFH